MSAAPAGLPGWRHLYSGKVRDLYEPDRAPAEPGGPDDVVLVVASDRVSAYDHVLSTPIPDKGRILTALSRWWFDRLGDLVEDHVLRDAAVPQPVQGRAMVCRRLDMLPVECVARGYLTGSGLADYRATGEVCGVRLPPDLHDGSRLPAPIFTPAAKAAVGEHDENVDMDGVVALVGRADAERLALLTLEVYRRAQALAGERGVVLADTKLEFGRVRGAGPDAPLVLGDEVLTPDSSRFWPAEDVVPGRSQPSFDKQVVRDWLTSPASGWDRRADQAPPPLPAEIVERTRQRYLQAYERIVGAPFA